MPKLLLADDSPTTQKVVQLTFADEGIDVIVADDGDTAMELYDHHHPDIVLADINIPGLNGYEVCETIRKRAWNGTTPVILLAGSFEPFDVEEAHRVGANDYLTKPFSSIRRLVATVTAMLDTVTRQDASADETIEPNSAPPHSPEPEFASTNDIEQLYKESVGREDAAATSAAQEQLQSKISIEQGSTGEEAPSPAAVAFGDEIAFDDHLIEATYSASSDATGPAAFDAPANFQGPEGNTNPSLESIPMPEIEPQPAEVPQSEIPTIRFRPDDSAQHDSEEASQDTEPVSEEERVEDPAPAAVHAEDFQIDQSGDEAFFEPAPETGSSGELMDQQAPEAVPSNPVFNTDHFQPESFAVPEIDQPAELEPLDSQYTDEPADDASQSAADEPDAGQAPTPWDSVAGPAVPRDYSLDGSDLLELPLEGRGESELHTGISDTREAVRALEPELIDQIAKLTAAEISENLIREIAERVVPRVVDEVLSRKRSEV